ncbi:phosphatidate cytidylyltransferase [Nitrospira moscoviensis]|uniref:phosphatidate cytidylyltransferase n=1 Tax=Nitrospira moscoviensis TaxID=42253 RepID=UPI0006A76498|nr:phosphatidate cytidylyltransferase [Nitrospira moscoviensis]
MATPHSAQAAGDAPPPIASKSSTGRRFDPRRVYTAVVLAPAIWAVIRYLPPWTFTLLLVAGGSIALFELYRMAFGGRTNRMLVGLGLTLAAFVISRAHLGLTAADVLLPGTMALILAMLFTDAPAEHRFKDTATVLFGVLYVGLTLGALAGTRALPGGEWLVLFVALVTWAGDTGAYYAGSLWGRHLLAPRVSPKKTMEGLLGGLVLSVLAALLARAWFLPGFSLADALILGILLTGGGLLGDLSESAIKRSAGVKDSGGILPGHGGMLDRLDSLLFTAPAFYYYVALVRGVTTLP